MDGTIVVLVLSYFVFFPLPSLCCCATFITYRIAFFVDVGVCCYNTVWELSSPPSLIYGCGSDAIESR